MDDLILAVALAVCNRQDNRLVLDVLRFNQAGLLRSSTGQERERNQLVKWWCAGSKQLVPIFHRNEMLADLGSGLF